MSHQICSCTLSYQRPFCRACSASHNMPSLSLAILRDGHFAPSLLLVGFCPHNSREFTKRARTYDTNILLSLLELLGWQESPQERCCFCRIYLLSKVSIPHGCEVVRTVAARLSAMLKVAAEGVSIHATVLQVRMSLVSCLKTAG